MRAALLEIELKQLASGDLPLSSIECEAEAIQLLQSKLRAHNLCALPLGTRVELASGESSGLFHRFAVARMNELDSAANAIVDDDIQKLLELSKHPSCCAFALATALAEGEASPLALWAASYPMQAGTSLSPDTNALLRPIGITTTPHVICAFGCTPSVREGELRIAEGREMGFGAEMSWLRSALEWPGEYSYRNGIGEVRTTTLRFSIEVETRSRSTDISWKGGLPLGVPKGPDDSAELLPDVQCAFQNHSVGAYGFSSAFSLRSRLASFVWEQSRRLRSGGSTLIDLRCGDGTLLELIECETRRLKVYGFDNKAELIDRARQRLPHRADSLHVCDFLESPSTARWRVDDKFDFAVLRPEDLLSLSPIRRQSILTSVFEGARCVLAYASEFAIEQHQSLQKILDLAGMRTVATLEDGDISAAVELF